MRKLGIASLAFGTAMLVPGPQAHAIEDGWDYDGGCGFASISDPTAESGIQTGAVYGSVAAYNTTSPGTSEVTLTCTIVVNGNPATSVSGSGTGVATIAATPISYAAQEGDDVRLCSTVAIVGVPAMVDCSGSATGTGGRCNGTVDANCTYCSNNGSGSGSNWSECDPPDDANYAWVGCTVWVANFCYVG